jgi:5-methyltetrahydropteroyltriglutamate--homocysteine methyltransferase
VKRSTDAILTTHTGSLPRPLSLVKLLLAKDRGEAVDAASLEREIRTAVDETVNKQLAAGVSVINDGEQGKTNFYVYRYERLTGFELVPGQPAQRLAVEARDYPEFFAHWLSGGQIREGRSTSRQDPVEVCCTGAIAWKDFSQVERDIANLKAATEGLGAQDVFMSAISPGTYLPRNEHYGREDDYLHAMADAMAREYAAIVNAGFVLQIDAPDLTVVWRQRDISMEAYLKNTVRCVELINHATRELPADRIRVHVCWGADEAPHHRDVPLKDIVDILLRLRPAGMTIPGANGRHSHEWKVWQDVKLPQGKIIVPGVIDSTTNIIEHPEAVAARILQYAGVLGRENIIAGVDCGFDTVADMGQVDPRIVWAKLASLAEGAALASQTLWSV